MELLFPLIIDISFICLQTCVTVGIASLLTTTCCNRDSSSEELSDHGAVKPKVSKEVFKTPEQKAALAKIKAGKMRPANQNETVEEAESNWGAVQKIEESIWNKFLPWTREWKVADISVKREEEDLR